MYACSATTQSTCCSTSTRPEPSRTTSRRACCCGTSTRPTLRQRTAATRPISARSPSAAPGCSRGARPPTRPRSPST
eukprot:5146637-Prymnesium_polylepis.1